MSDVVIHAEHLGKLYRLGDRPRYKTVRDAIAAPLARLRSRARSDRSPSAIRIPHSEIRSLPSAIPNPPPNTFWALQDVSFEVRQGEVVGIIGRNGAGKSTLLRILSRITEPTAGYADITGRVGSLLEVGTGFHPELTGRENIYLNGAILGMKRAEITRKFDEIVAFAETEKFIDTPVKHYSSGMYVRLAFAVAAHLEPEILLVDEVLAVGDAAFQEKCLGKMGAVAREGRTVLFVSHNLAAVTAMCSKAHLLHEGRLLSSGTPAAIVAEYIERIRSTGTVSLRQRRDREGSGKLRFDSLALRNDAGEVVDTVSSGQDLTLEVGYVAATRAPLRNVSMAIAWYNTLGQFLFLCANEMAGERFREIPARGRLVCRIPRLPLAPGRYALNLYCEVNGMRADYVKDAAHFGVVEGDFFGTGKLPPPSHGGLLVPQQWSLGAS